MRHETAHDGSGVGELDFVPAIERMADDIAARMLEMAHELENQKKILAALLKHVGVRAVCKGPKCQQDIFLVDHKATSGKRTPYNADGTNHFGTCVDRDLFRRGK